MLLQFSTNTLQDFTTYSSLEENVPWGRCEKLCWNNINNSTLTKCTIVKDFTKTKNDHNVSINFS